MSNEVRGAKARIVYLKMTSRSFSLLIDSTYRDPLSSSGSSSNSSSSNSSSSNECISRAPFHVKNAQLR